MAGHRRNTSTGAACRPFLPNLARGIMCSPCIPHKKARKPAGFFVSFGRKKTQAAIATFSVNAAHAF